MCKSRRFRLETHTKRVALNVKPHRSAYTKMEFRCQMTQLPVNLNDATTGHKLQDMSKDAVIITSWPKGGLFKNWEYTVLSRVRTLDGLFLFKDIDMEKSFEPSDELKAYFQNARTTEKHFIKRQKMNMEKFYKNRQRAKITSRN